MRTCDNGHFQSSLQWYAMATATSTRVLTRASHTMPKWSLPKPPWPNPEASICELPRWVCPVNGKHIWSIQGPALDAYNSIRLRLTQCLVDREQDLYRDAGESSVPHSIDCMMVGSKKARARPYVVVYCNEKSFSKSVMRVVKDTIWWKDFIDVYQGFGGFLLLSNAPRRAANADDRTRPSWVYTSSKQSYINGMPIFFTTEPLGEEERCRPQQATLGGILYLDHVPFGLTVAHPLFNDEEGGKSVKIPSQLASSMFYMDDSDDEGSVDDDDNDDDYGEDEHHSDSTPSTTSTTPSSSAAKKSMEFPPSVPLLGSPRLVGQTLSGSEGSPSDAVDWILIVLNGIFLKSFPTRPSPDQNVFKGRYFSDFAAHAPPRTVSHVFDSGTPTSISNGAKAPHKGIWNANESLVCLPRTHRYLSLKSVVLDSDLHVGDCGTWALDIQGNWYGHIVAGMPGTRTAYVVDASQIIESIRDKTCVTTAPLSPDAGCYTVAREMTYSDIGAIDQPMDVYAVTLYAAAKFRCARVVDLLLNAGVDVDARGGRHGNALQIATLQGNDHIVRLLIKAGANVNAQTDCIYGNPLMAASAAGHEQIVQLLIDAGADVNASGDYVYGNALQAASVKGHEQVVRLLIKAGADVDVRIDHVFVNPLLIASAMGHEQIVQLLVDARAEFNVWSDHVYSDALQSALETGNERIVKRLLNSTADISLQGPRHSVARLDFPSLRSLDLPSLSSAASSRTFLSEVTPAPSIYETNVLPGDHLIISNTYSQDRIQALPPQETKKDSKATQRFGATKDTQHNSRRPADR